MDGVSCRRLPGCRVSPDEELLMIQCSDSCCYDGFHLQRRLDRLRRWDGGSCPYLPISHPYSIPSLNPLLLLAPSCPTAAAPLRPPRGRYPSHYRREITGDYGGTSEEGQRHWEVPVTVVIHTPSPHSAINQSSWLAGENWASYGYLNAFRPGGSVGRDPARKIDFGRSRPDRSRQPQAP